MMASGKTYREIVDNDKIFIEEEFYLLRILL